MATDLVRQLEAHEFKWMPWKEAKDEWADFRAEHGAKRAATPLLTAPNKNAKFNKTECELWGLSLAQATMSELYNTCRFSTPECRRGCVSFAGKGELSSVQRGRRLKTLFLAEHTDAFYVLLIEELERIWKAHKQSSANLRVRLNTFSDIPWERMDPNLFQVFDRMRFFDYTKWWQRGIDANLGWYGWPGNYRVIMSASEKTPDQTIIDSVEQGMNYAVVFAVKKGEELPAFWNGVRVADGDIGDDRWRDERGIIVGLRAKGRMRKGVWGMARNPEGKVA